jgi:hypothetical protein
MFSGVVELLMRRNYMRLQRNYTPPADKFQLSSGRPRVYVAVSAHQGPESR